MEYCMGCNGINNNDDGMIIMGLHWDDNVSYGYDIE